MNPPCPNCLYDDEQLVKLCLEHEEIFRNLPKNGGMTCKPQIEEPAKTSTELIETFINEMEKRGWFVQVTVKPMKPMKVRGKKNDRTPT